MNDSNVCDNCKREPVAFKTDTNETAYWLMVPKENQDPSHLTSALDFVFVAMVAENDDRRHPIDDDHHYWCVDCCAATYPDQKVLWPICCDKEMIQCAEGYYCMTCKEFKP